MNNCEKIKMENIFIKLNIIDDLSIIILKYLTTSHYNILKKNTSKIDYKKIIKYDSKLMVKIKKKLDKRTIMSECVTSGKLENVKWLLKNKYPIENWTFSYAAGSGNLEIMKWLLKHEFPIITIHKSHRTF